VMGITYKPQDRLDKVCPIRKTAEPPVCGLGTNPDVHAAANQSGHIVTNCNSVPTAWVAGSASISVDNNCSPLPYLFDTSAGIDTCSPCHNGPCGDGCVQESVAVAAHDHIQAGNLLSCYHVVLIPWHGHTKQQHMTPVARLALGAAVGERSAVYMKVIATDTILVDGVYR
jgi:hypothetical protein